MQDALRSRRWTLSHGSEEFGADLNDNNHPAVSTGVSYSASSSHFWDGSDAAHGTHEVRQRPKFR